MKACGNTLHNFWRWPTDGPQFFSEHITPRPKEKYWETPIFSWKNYSKKTRWCFCWRDVKHVASVAHSGLPSMCFTRVLFISWKPDGICICWRLSECTAFKNFYSTAFKNVYNTNTKFQARIASAAHQIAVAVATPQTSYFCTRSLNCKSIFFYWTECNRGFLHTNVRFVQ